MYTMWSIIIYVFIINCDIKKKDGIKKIILMEGGFERGVDGGGGYFDLYSSLGGKRVVRAKFFEVLIRVGGLVVCIIVLFK